MKAEKVLTFLITTFIFGLLLDLSFLSALSHFLFSLSYFFPKSYFRNYDVIFPFQCQTFVVYEPAILCSDKSIFSSLFSVFQHLNSCSLVLKKCLSISSRNCELSQAVFELRRKSSTCIQATVHPSSVSLWKKLAPRVDENPDVNPLTRRSRLLVRIASPFYIDRDFIKLIRSEGW